MKINKKGFSFITWVIIGLVTVWGVYQFFPEKVPTIKESLSSAVSTGLDRIGNVNISKVTNITNENELNSTKEPVYIQSPYNQEQRCKCFC